MTPFRQAAVVALGLAVASTGVAMAGQSRPYRLSDSQLSELAKRVDTHAEGFRDTLKRAVDRSAINGTATEGEIDRAVKAFEQATETLRDRVNDRQSVRADAESVLTRAASIDAVMTRNQFETSAERAWQTLRLDMDDLARAYGIDRNWAATAQDMPRRIDDKQVEQLLKQIEQKAGRFEKSLDRPRDRRQAGSSQQRDDVKESVKDFRQTADRLRDRVGRRQSNTQDVEELLRRGMSIDRYMQSVQASPQAEQGWRGLRGDLDQLARAYNMPWNWSDSGYTQAQPDDVRHRLTGTYQLENAQGDNPRQVAEQAVRVLSSSQRQAMYQRLLRRMEAPATIAIEREDGRITMASTRGPRVTFDADGRNHQEAWAPGRTMTTRATLAGERLTVETEGNRDDDFTVVFDPTADGRSLQVTRTVDMDGLRQPVTTRSVYRRLSDQARWGLDGSNRRDRSDNDRRAVGDAAVPDGIHFVAVLDTDLSSETTRVEDPYTMTVQSPSQYQGAVVHGIVSSVSESGRLTGHAGMTLALETIRLRDGRTQRFDGTIESVRTPGGETLRVDQAGVIDDGDSQTATTVQRGAIGAALGAVIGAIADGATGAAIGAAIGAGAGAGSVIVGGRERLDLPRGTELSFTSGVPAGQLTSAAAPR